jgi:hypothetical protein
MAGGSADPWEIRVTKGGEQNPEVLIGACGE